MFKLSFLKYRGLFLSTTGFVLFFVLYLLVNYAIQRNVVADIEYANAVQRIEATLLNQGVSDELAQQLQAIQQGGEIVFSQQDRYTLEAIDQHLVPAVSNIDSLLQALQLDNTADIYANMQRLNKIVFDKKERSIKLLGTLQIIAAILTVLLYFMVIVQLVLQLSKTDIVDVQSKQETEGIMNTISEGLFLLDNYYEIGSEQSKSLKGMFKSEKDLEGNFLDFIGRYVTQTNVELAQEYLQLLFGERVKERLIEELNPLKEVEVNIVRRDGTFENHYLDFKFNRVLVDGKVSHLLGSVNNVTKQVLLERELSEAKETQQAQLDMLKSILHIDSHKLSLFFNNVSDVLHSINNSLEVNNKSFSDAEIRQLLNGIAANVHQIKGDSAALGLHRFEFSAHDLEDSIEKIKTENTSITGKELLPVTTGLRSMFGDLEDMKELVNKFSDVRIARSVDTGGSLSEAVQSVKPEPLPQDSLSQDETHVEVALDKVDVSQSLSQLVDTVAQRNNKTVNLRAHGLAAGQVPEYLVNAVQSIAVQLVRNSIVHGIETAEQRNISDKDEAAVIDVKLSQSEQGYILTSYDDGKGIDEQEILEKAVAKGIIKAEQMSKIANKKIPALLFHPGFSSLDEASLDAGRGMGLDVVKKMVNDLGGKINIKYEKGQYCQFKILFPFA